MKKYLFLFFAGGLLLSVFAFTSNSSHKEKMQLKEYDQKIENLNREIQELRKSEQNKAAILDNLLNTI